MHDDIPHTFSTQDTLVALMVAISASDENIRTAELVKINTAVNNLPVFAGYDADRLQTIAQIVFDLFEHCLLYTSPSPRDQRGSRMPSSA